MTWTPERIDTLKRMVADGAEYSKIADALGGGITRNAVIGKAERLGLCDAHPRRKNPKIKRAPHSSGANWRARVAQRIRRADRHPPVSVEPPAVIATANPVPFLAFRPNACRFPLWGDEPVPLAEKLCCGASTIPGQPWCAEHNAVVFTRGSQRDFDRMAAAA